MEAKPRWLALELAFAAAMLGTAAFQHWAKPGVESELLVLGFVLGPAHARRLLAGLGRAAPPSLLLLALEVVAITGAFAGYPVAGWGMIAGLVTALGHATATGVGRAPRWLEAVAALGQGAALLLLAHDASEGRPLAWFRLALLAPVLVESVRAGRERASEDVIRRLAAAVVIAATSRSTTLDLPFHVLYVGAVSLVHLAVLGKPAAERTRARRRVAARVAVPPLTLGVLLLFGEAAFRIVPNRYHEIVPPRPNGTRHQPGGTYLYEGAFLGPRQPRSNLVRWNKEGWHDVDHERAKPPRTARIAVLGDSYVEGVQVNVDALYHRQLERALAKPDLAVEAIAFGWSGWGQRQELEALEKHAFAYAPDLVIAEFLPGNDVRNNDDELEKQANEESVSSSTARWLFVRCVSAGLPFHAMIFDKTDLLLRRSRGHRDPVDSDVYREKPLVTRPEAWANAWRRTEAHLEAMAKASRERGATLLVVVFTSPLEIESRVPDARPTGDMDFALPARRVTAICAARGIPCLDLALHFARLPRPERDALHLAGDGHWAEPGHKQAAEETRRFLEEGAGAPVWSAIVERARVAR